MAYSIHALHHYKMFSLGSINCLKILKEIKDKIIKITSVILTTTTLFIRSEKNAEGIGTSDKFTTKIRIDSY